MGPIHLMSSSETNEPRLVSGQKSLRDRIQHGGAVFIASFGFRNFLRLGSNLILTRLLAPEAFAVMAVVIALNALLVNLSDVGIESSVVRSKSSHNRDFLFTAWTMRLARNFLVYILMVMIAGSIALATSHGMTPAGSVYADPILPLIIIVTGLQVVIAGTTSINRYVADRDISAGRIAILQIATQIVMTLVTLATAFAGLGVWAIVWGMIAGTIFEAAASYFVFKGPMMQFRFHRDHAHEIFNFGKWLVLASFLGFLTHRGDQFVFGWAFEDTSFGFYAVAGTWVFTAKNVLTMLTRQLFFPGYSEILRERPKALPAAYAKSRLATDAMSVIGAFAVFFFSEFLVRTLYPEEFWTVGYYMKLMAPMLLVFPYTLLHYVSLAHGDSKQFTLVTITTSFLSIFGTIAFLTYFGEKAGIIFFGYINALAAPVAIAVASKVMKINWVRELRILVPAAILGVLLVMTPGYAG